MPSKLRAAGLLAAGLFVSALAVSGCSEPAAPPSGPDLVVHDAPPPASSSGRVASSAPPEDRAPAPATKTLFVAEQMVDCEGEGPMRCLRVRGSEAEEWRLLYVPIAGFEHEAGYRYELRVVEQAKTGAPEGGASVKYVLAEIVSKTPVPAR